MLPVLARRGLPQGASSSPMVAEFVVGRVIAEASMPEGTVLVTSADDFAIHGRHRADVEEAVSELRRAFTHHPAGDFHLKFGNVRRISDGFEFLGYEVRRRKGVELIRPSKRNRERFKHRAHLWLWRILKGDDRRDVERSMRSWCNAFGNIPDAVGAVASFLVKVLGWRSLRDMWPAFRQLLQPFRAKLRQVLADRGGELLFGSQ